MNKAITKRSKTGLISFRAVFAGLATYLPTLVTFLTSSPYWELAFTGVAGIYGAYMVLHQEEVDELLEFIKNHPKEFRQNIVNSKEFEKGFIVFAETYFKERIKRKKKIIEQIFLGYVSSQDKEAYELERLNDCLVRLTVPYLEFLIFIKDTILPTLDAQIEEELKQDLYQKSDRSMEWWQLQMLTQKSVWEPVSIWLEDNYNPARPKVKEDYGIKNEEGWPADLGHRADTRNRDKESGFNASMSELVTLGIIDIKIGGASWGGGGSKGYSLTSFGIKFIRLAFP